MKKFFRCTCLVFIFVFLSGCFSQEYDIATHRQDIYFYSTNKEIAIGRNVAKAVAEKYKFCQEPSLNEKIRRIGQKITSVCDRKELIYHFYIIDDKTVNAFSLPGGFVYIFRGLLDKLKTDDEIAFVLGHEVGHIVARHAIKRLQAAMASNLLLIASTQVKSSGNLPQGVYLALISLMSGYSQEDEFLADKLGITYAERAGYNPQAGIKVLEMLEKENEKSPAHQISYFRTHPYPIPRIRAIKEELGLPLDFRDLANN